MVPARTDIFRMLILQMFWRTAIRTVQNTRLQHTYSQMWASRWRIMSLVTSVLPFSPLKMAK